MLRITIFNEFVHEKTQEHVKAIYPLASNPVLMSICR